MDADDPLGKSKPGLGIDHGHRLQGVAAEWNDFNSVNKTQLTQLLCNDRKEKRPLVKVAPILDILILERF